MAENPPMVEFHKVAKRYGPVTAVDDVSFALARGTLTTLLGPSGCGKTTTLRLIAGLETASDGTILIDGGDVTGRSAAERDVSMVFQSYALFPHLNVLDNVAYGLVVSGTPKRTAHEAARAKLELIGLSGLDARLPSELSGGQQQRVAVARAIVLEPRVLLFDEPLSNLDAKLRRRVRDDIRALQQRLALTVVYVTHDQEEALAVSDRIIVMSQARIAQDGTPRHRRCQPGRGNIAAPHHGRPRHRDGRRRHARPAAQRRARRRRHGRNPARSDPLRRRAGDRQCDRRCHHEIGLSGLADRIYARQPGRRVVRDRSHRPPAAAGGHPGRDPVRAQWRCGDSTRLNPSPFPRSFAARAPTLSRIASHCGRGW